MGKRKSSIGRIQNPVDPRGIDSIFHGGPDSGIYATLRQAEDRMAEKPDVNNLTMSEI